MRLGQAIFFGSAAAPPHVGSADARQKFQRAFAYGESTEAPAPPPAKPTSRAADGSWTQRPCQETGAKAPAPARSAQRARLEETQ